MKRILSCLLAGMLMLGLAGCGKSAEDVKVGVSFGVGPAARWPQEQAYMEQRAKELGIHMETKFNTTDEPTQLEDCKALIDSGIDVLILIPRDAGNAGEIIDYAKSKKVKVISYARVVLNQDYDLFVGYDSGRIGQTMGQYLAELVYEGDYIILRGDPSDNNATLLYDGAMRGIEPVKADINILLDESVPGWSPEEAKKMVLDAVKKNGNKVDAILAPNDKLAGACVEALKELGIDPQSVAITGMDAELEAVQRIVGGQQSMTVYMDLQVLADTAVGEAYQMAMGKEAGANANFNNGNEGGVSANLITGQIVTKENIDKILIDSGYFTREEVYGK